MSAKMAFASRHRAGQCRWCGVPLSSKTIGRVVDRLVSEGLELDRIRTVQPACTWCSRWKLSTTKKGSLM